MIVAVIPAKEESRRLTYKNLAKIGGKSLVAHAVEYARKASKIDRIIVSTDDVAIEAHVRALGVETLRRGVELGGETPLMDVYRHALNHMALDGVTHIVGIQPDHPDRTTDLDDAIVYILEKCIDDLVTVDRNGVRNGALRILSRRALEAQPPIYPSAIMDDCTNIHTPFDFHMAAFNMASEKDPVYVGEQKIGTNEPVFIIAEAACNHMCDMKMARKMIDKAAEAGANAIKFQTYTAEKLVTKDAKAFWGQDKISQLEYYKRLDRFGKKEYQALFEYADHKGIVPFSSPFDAENVDMLADLGMKIFKIASCDICNLSLVEHIAKYKKPIILSTGASTLEEIEQALLTIFKMGNYQVFLLACTLSYPTKNEEANLMRIRTLKEHFHNMIIGLSDHTEPDPNMIIPSVAVSLGAKVIEKHYTLDRTMTGSGHFFAADPGDLKKMVENIRLTEAVLGAGKLGVASSEISAWKNARRGLVAEVPILKGTPISSEMVGVKRPAAGMCPSKIDEVIGKRAALDIQADEPITPEKLTN
jgi:sialic acid synthase SpsE/spore coat polysaccharide biosynthesis protein SpsF (cytidylyltransferase family)